MQLEKSVETKQKTSLDREELLVYSPQQAANILGISKSLLYKELKQNPAFPRKMIGGRIIIPCKSLEEYINSGMEVSR